MTYHRSNKRKKSMASSRPPHYQNGRSSFKTGLKNSKHRKIHHRKNTSLGTSFIKLLIAILFFLLILYFFKTSHIFETGKEKVSSLFRATQNSIHKKNEEKVKKEENLKWANDYEYLVNEIFDHYANLPLIKISTGKDLMSKKKSFLSQGANISSEEDLVKKAHSFLNVLYDQDATILEHKSYEDLISATQNTLFLDQFKNIRFPDSNSDAKTESQTTTEHTVELTTPVKGKIALIKIPYFGFKNKEDDGKKIKDFIIQISSYDSIILDVRNATGFNLSYLVDNILLPLAREPITFEGNYLITDNKYEDSLVLIDNSVKIDPKLYPLEDLQKKYSLSPELLGHYIGYKKFHLSIPKNENCRFRGKIYVLQNAQTKDSADILSQISLQTGFGTTCGTSTMGYGMNLVPAFIKLPNSNYVIQFTSRLGLNSDGTINSEQGSQAQIKTQGQNPVQQLMQIIK